MDVLQILTSLGFKAESLPDKSRRDGLIYKIRTDRGWVYERFQSADEATLWAQKHKPE